MDGSATVLRGSPLLSSNGNAGLEGAEPAQARAKRCRGDTPPGKNETAHITKVSRVARRSSTSTSPAYVVTAPMCFDSVAAANILDPSSAEAFREKDTQKRSDMPAGRAVSKKAPLRADALPCAVLQPLRNAVERGRCHAPNARDAPVLCKRAPAASLTSVKCKNLPCSIVGNAVPSSHIPCKAAP